jgi:alpha-beta hydrolase superfamily lysophospholipase
MLVLKDGAEPFDVTLLEPANASRVVLFAAGRGGDPTRHLPLLRYLSERGCTVVAPHFALLSPVPSEQDLALRARRLHLALDAVTSGEKRVAGVGHSVGAALLLGLAGAQLWVRAGRKVAVRKRPDLERLVLLAPATDFVQAPGALDAVQLPVLTWAGTQDELVPRERVESLRDALGERAPFELHFAQGANHFSFMDTPPPQTSETLADRAAFLGSLHHAISRFITA